jgi:hypothetical protein
LDHMRSFALIIGLALVCVGCGRIVSAIPRHKEIERPVTVQDVIGSWALTTNSLGAVAVDGFSPKPGEEVVVTVRSNASYTCHMIVPRWDGKRVVDRADEEGQWSLDYSPTDHFKNRLVLRSSRGAGWSLYVGTDSGRMVLWKSWGDPDDGIDLVFQNVRGL